MKIYVENKALYLVTGPNLNDLISEEERGAQVFQLNDLQNPTDAFEMLNREHVASLLFWTGDVEDAVRTMGLAKIVASGGLVTTPKKDVLLIYRRGTWDLPKGKVDDGETLEACALREIEEETGVGNLILRRKLLTTYHTYYEKEKHILKECHWFLVQTDGLQPLVPQTDEDIQECRWVRDSELEAYKNNMPASIRDVLQAFASQR